MDGLKISDYANFCRLCLCKGSNLNRIFNTQNHLEIIEIVLNCTSIVLNTTETLPQNICRKCTKRLTQFNIFRGNCLKNDELIRLHSLIHCDTNESDENTLNGSADDIQDSSDYVLEELKEEFGVKENNLIVNDISIAADDDIIESEFVEPTLTSKRRGRPKKTQQAIDMHSMETIDPNTESIDEDYLRKSIRARKPNPKFDVTSHGVAEAQLQTSVDIVNNLVSDRLVGNIISSSETNSKKGHNMGIDGDTLITPPMSPNSLARYKRRKKIVPKSSRKYLMDETLDKPKYYYNVTAKCELCDTILPRKVLKFHMNEHNGVYPYKCDQCGRSYSSPWKRARHIKVVHVDRLLICAECGGTFKSKMNLVRHQRTTHQQSNVTECTLCNRKFTCRDSLKRHMMMHTGERPYVCTVCNKSFQNTFNLKTHLRRHTKEKPYKCLICDCAFGYPGVLKNHLDKIHNCMTTTINTRNININDDSNFVIGDIVQLVPDPYVENA